jgi:hypothetical protein
VLVKGVVRGGLGKACGFIVVTAFSIRAVIAYLPTPALVGIANEFRSL